MMFSLSFVGGWGGGGPNLGGVQIRWDTGIPGEKSGLKYPKPLQSLFSMNQVNLFFKVKILIKR